MNTNETLLTIAVSIISIIYLALAIRDYRQKIEEKKRKQRKEFLERLERNAQLEALMKIEEWKFYFKTFAILTASALLKSEIEKNNLTTKNHSNHAHKI